MRVKTEARRMAYIQAAGKLFLLQGFSAVSMEAIAAQTGGSKVTLYNYFSSKEALFEAFVIEAGREAVNRLLEVPLLAGDIRSVLTELGMAYLRLITTPTVIALDRLIIGEAGRQPELAAIFYKNGPKRTISVLVSVIENLIKTAQIHPGKPGIIAMHFKGLCEADILDRFLWGLDIPGDDELEKGVQAAVDVFIKGYGTKA